MNISNFFQKYSVSINSLQIELFEKFLVLFLEKNKLVNLSAIRDETSVIEKHFIDSIILNNFIKLSWKILDIGTGWGFPGIPLAISNPDCKLILIDSTRKKIESVNEFSQKLDLKNCTWVWWRAEELSLNPEYRQQFDFVVSRATAYLPQIIERSLPFLKKWWKLIFYKLFNEKEIKDWEIILKKNWMKIENIFKYEIWDQERVLIITWLIK
ncbi:MAG: Ribosomal RNA small subunit methyltransferase G [uncultured bacterium (gcode 4)]|uniref:Ribosomal RNA small subunit methyltransferase G n=1 Tax=uncultured bacterium (gcode 4) TaxID=1234023 RepID=K2BVI9_9BACT|nr:MAG: Ribosomal RNA small subunit methyltransferase G [uncultured bacterium (gcode 4)]